MLADAEQPVEDNQRHLPGIGKAPSLVTTAHADLGAAAQRDILGRQCGRRSEQREQKSNKIAAELRENDEGHRVGASSGPGRARSLS